MKVDMSNELGRATGAAPAPGPERGDRWLAQLELAYLGTLHADAPQPRREGSQGRDDAPRSARPPAAQGEGELAAAKPVAAPLVSAWSALSAGQAVLASAAPVPPPGGPYADVATTVARGTEAFADDDDAGTSDTPRTTTLPDGTGGPASARSRGPAPDAQGMSQMSASVLAETPRYARQFMQLSLADPTQAQASVRDASLSAAGEAAVAHAVTAQLRSDGVAVQRVFVNGRRFDADTLSAANAAPRIFTNHPQE